MKAVVKVPVDENWGVVVGERSVPWGVAEAALMVYLEEVEAEDLHSGWAAVAARCAGR